MTVDGDRSRLAALTRRLRQIDLEQLRRGWLLVPAAWIQEAVASLASRQELVESARLTLEDGAGELELVLRSNGLRPRAVIRGRVRLTTFSLTKSRGIAVLEFDDAPDIAVDAQGLFGRYAGTAVAKALERLFESEEARRRLQTKRDVWELEWPRLTIHLDRIEAIHRLRNNTVAGISLLDLVSFGPAEVSPEGIRIRVRPTGLGNALQRGVQSLRAWLQRRSGA